MKVINCTIFLVSLWMSWHPFSFMVQCMTFMTSYTTINNSLWVQCFFIEVNPGWLFAKNAHVNFSFGNCFSLQRPQIHHIADKNGFIDSKNLVSISLLNQGNHNMGHLWIQTDHNLDHKCPNYGQPSTIDMYDQTMISLESCSIYYGRVWSACFCMGGQPEWSIPLVVHRSTCSESSYGIVLVLTLRMLKLSKYKVHN